jgi:hypothetical protein
VASLVFVIVFIDPGLILLGRPKGFMVQEFRATNSSKNEHSYFSLRPFMLHIGYFIRAAILGGALVQNPGFEIST